MLYANLTLCDKAVIDSEDLPLNISREMLQKNPVLAKIKSGLTKRVLGELQKKAENDPEAFATFWDNFGAVLKEGLYVNLALPPATPTNQRRLMLVRGVFQDPREHRCLQVNHGGTIGRVYGAQ